MLIVDIALGGCFREAGGPLTQYHCTFLYGCQSFINPQAMNDHSALAEGMLGEASSLSKEGGVVVTFLAETQTAKPLESKPSGVLAKMTALLSGLRANKHITCDIIR